MKIKMKRMLALLLCVATVFTFVSAEVYALDYTITVKSNDGTTVLFTATVASGTVVTFTTDGLSLSTGETYTYSGELEFYGYATTASATIAEYAPGDVLTVSTALTLYICEGNKLGGTIVGDEVDGATRYELCEMFELQEQYERPKNYLEEKYPYYLMGRVKRNLNGLVEEQYFAIFSEIPRNAYCFDVVNSGGAYNCFRITDTENAGGDSSFKSYCFAKTTNNLNDLLQNLQSVLDSWAVKNYSYSWANNTYKKKVQMDVEVEFLYSNMGDISISSDASITNYPEYYTVSFEDSSKPYRMTFEDSFDIIDSFEIISFDLSKYEFDGGDHRLAVRALGEGYLNSNFSNEVVYSVEPKYNVNISGDNVLLMSIDETAMKNYIFEGRPLSVKLEPSEGYILDDVVTVTMGGVTLTAGTDYRYYPDTGNLVILSVTGDVIITAQGIRKVASPVIERNIGAETNEYPLALTFASVANASGYSVYIGGTKIESVVTSETDGIVTLKVKADAFASGSGTYEVYVIAEPAENYVASNPSNTLSEVVAIQVATPVAAALPDLRTEEYPFVCSVTKPEHSGSLVCYVNDNHCGTVTYETDANGDWIAYLPLSAFSGSGEYEIYFVALGETIDYVESESSNRLTFTIRQLSTPVIWLE